LLEKSVSLDFNSLMIRGTIYLIQEGTEEEKIW
ncbi:hypothetical protein Q604_UNBc4C00288G0002, partial [human gut metagenome]